MADTGVYELTETAAFTNPLQGLVAIPEQFEWLIGECGKLIDAEIKQKGMTVRAAVSLAQRAKPGLTEQTLRELLPGFVAQLEPFYFAWRHHGQTTFGNYLVVHDHEVAEALLTVTDHRIAPVENWPIRKGYERLRHRAEQEVTCAVPAIAATLAQQVDAQQKACAG